MGNCFAHECSRRRPSKTGTRVASTAPDLSHRPLEYRKGAPAAAEAKRLPPPATKGTTMASAEKKNRKVRFADDVLVLDAEREKSRPNKFNDADKRDVMRVKMVLTKKEAALLLSILGGGDQGGGAALEGLLCDAQAAAKGHPAIERKEGWKPTALERTPEIE